MSQTREFEKRLFDGALALEDPAARRAFLHRSCGDDPGLLRRLENLLSAHAQAGEFFARTALPGLPGSGELTAAATAGDAPPPAAASLQLTGTGADARCHTRIGRYQLIQRIGDGGCGVVYVAEQQEPVRRRVALKIVRLGMDTESVINRFEAERQALALMDHPNIARVLDAGATETGRPFFVMELVHGIRITEFCAHHRLDLAARLHLFVEVCHAIQHAHQKGVVHRDIKPSNILVALHDDRPAPKVIDFGIAKATATSPLVHATRTRRDQFIGTPAYMSPEQIAGAAVDVDTRSDIYSLGVLLYELLTGRPPFDARRLAEVGVEELRRLLLGHEPPRPSALFASLEPAEAEKLAAERRSDPPALAGILRGDLDWIVMRALAKDRRQRYETANGLARDVQRFLEHEPVSARPPSWSYRLGKLVRRNRAVFTAGALVAVALMAGLGTSTWMFFRERAARQEQARLRQVAEEARANEAALRHQSEVREKISQAAVQLSYNNYAAADALLAEVPLPLSVPSLEAAGVFRTVGVYHALAGRWPQAVEHLTALTQAITGVDASDTDNVSRDILPASAATRELGDDARYEAFREWVVGRFAGTHHAVVAEQVLKATELGPADAAFMERLAPFAATVEREFTTGDNGDAYMVAWRCFALALYHYRAGAFAEAGLWGRRCLASTNRSPAREATIRLVMAMADHRLGREASARTTVEAVRADIQEVFRKPLVAGGSTQGFWFDWIIARIFLREADALLGNTGPEDGFAAGDPPAAQE